MRWTWRMGPQERDAQRVLDEMPAAARAALSLEEAERLSDEVWRARRRDRKEPKQP